MKTGRILVLIIMMGFAGSCSNDEPETTGKDEQFISIPSFIKSQIAHVDTSLYSIIYIRHIDSTHSDTIPVRREEFRTLASDFISIPDIAEKKYRKRYKEEKMFDQMLNRVIITYIPVEPEDELIQRQEMLITPDPSGDRVSNIIIDYFLSTKDSSVQKKMLWQADKNFQVTTIKQLPGQQETISTTKVIWNQ